MGGVRGGGELIRFLFMFFVSLWFYFSPPFMCYAEDRANNSSTDMTDSPAVSKEETNILPEDYNFNIESVAAEKVEDWKNLTFMDFLRSHLLFMAVTMKHSSPLTNSWTKMNLPSGWVNRYPKSYPSILRSKSKKDFKNMN